MTDDYSCDSIECKRIRKRCGHIKKQIDDIMENGGDSHRLTILQADFINCVRKEQDKIEKENAWRN